MMTPSFNVHKSLYFRTEEDELENTRRFVSTMSLNSRSSSLESFEWDTNFTDTMSSVSFLFQFKNPFFTINLCK